MIRVRWGLVAAIVVFAAAERWGAAEEPAQAFVDALRDRGFYDVAIDYLATADSNPAIPTSFKEILLYEKAATLIRGAHQARDLMAREQQLDEAQRALAQFVKEKPGNLLVMAARNQHGSLLVERARGRVERAKKLPSAEQTSLLRQARDQYSEGSKLYAAVVEELRTKLKTYPAALDAKADAGRIAERDRHRQDFMQAQFLAACAREEMADTMPQSSKERVQTLTVAAEEFARFHESYRTRSTGLYARVYQGRCLQKLGKHKDASALFDELLDQDGSEDAFRAIRLKAMALAVESWMQQRLHPVIIERAAGMIEAARPADERADEVMTLRLYVARATKAYADQLQAKNPRDPAIRKLLADGRKQVLFLTRTAGEHQEAARRMLPEFMHGDAETSASPPPQTFADALGAAKRAIDGLQAVNLLVRNLPSRIAAARPSEKEQLQKQLADAKQQVAKGQAEAMQHCRLALELAHDDTPINEINHVRYLMCFLLYGQQDHFDAIVIGELLARRYPESPYARQCAKIALASYVNLHTEGGSDEKQFEERQAIALGDYMVSRWPGQPEADEALSVLIPFMIRARKLQQAQDYLARIPSDSPQRSSAELKTGQALWASYLESSKRVRNWESGATALPDGTDLAAQSRELEELKANARQTLLSGIERMRKGGEVDRVLVTAVLSLAQIYVDTGEASKAITLLEDPKIGALTLVERNERAAADNAVAEETYKTALRAHISSLADGGRDAKAAIDKARGIMEALKKRVSQDPQGPQRLVSVYVGLARDLQRQMEIADASARKSLGEGFETFLTQVSTEATDLNVLNWVGDAYLGMGEAFGVGVKSQAKSFFSKAAATYQKILDKGKADESFLPPQAATAIRIKLAKAKKGTGDYIAAADTLEAILKADPTILPAQIEAARLYQEWGGTAKGQHANYVRAIVGARPDKAKNNRNTIWGWGEIARRTAFNEQLKDQFYDARYNLALCRYQFALAHDNDREKQKQLQMAKRDIAATAGLYPELGGDEKKKDYDGLLKNIQRALGERADGLKGLQSSSVSTTVPASK